VVDDEITASNDPNASTSAPSAIAGSSTIAK
jgi:hypothetical protein